jgi:hypothetical protein
VWACYSGYRNFARFGREPKSLATRAWDPGLYAYEATTVIDGEILVVEDEASETARSGWSACYHKVNCSVVWADACAGRVGYSCSIAIGAPRGGPYPDGLDSVECRPTRTESGELTLQ